MKIPDDNIHLMTQHQTLHENMHAGKTRAARLHARSHTLQCAAAGDAPVLSRFFDQSSLAGHQQHPTAAATRSCGTL